MVALDVICVGAATLDTIACVPFIPGEDERIVASAIETAGGGPAATAAVALARLGARVGFCGVVGDDEAGRAVRAGLEAESVNTEWLETRPGASTTRALILVSEATSGRTIVTREATAPDPSLIPVGVSTWLHADQTGFAAVRAALAAVPTSTLLSVDAGNPIDTVDLAGVDLYAPTVESLRRRYPAASTVSDALQAALADGAAWVVATAGSHGSVMASTAGEEHVAAFSVPVVSSLGAGDVFHGALLAGLVAGLPRAQAASEASAAAAMSCAAFDGRSAIPSRDALDNFLRSERASHDSLIAE